jgi:phosphate-selective porin OprO and OprP
MTTASKKFLAALVAAPLVAALAPQASAAPQDTETRIKALQQQLEAMQAEIDALRKAQSEQAADVKKQTDEIQNRVADTEKKQKSSVSVSLKGGRPTFAAPDGDFTASLRGNLQVDYAYYMQSARAKGLSAGPDMSSGTNIRRAQLGLEGTVFGDWAYRFNYEFGGTSTEGGGKILNAYLEYDGLAPFAFRVGAFAPSINTEDQTSSSDLMFLERNSPSTVVRNIAGADDRLGVSVIYAGSRLFGAVSLTGDRIGSSGYFDEQVAAVGRLAYLAIDDKENNARLMLGANLAYVIQPDDLLANKTAGKMHTVTLSDYPEITVDDNATKLISTGALTADHVAVWGFEAAGNYENFYLQAGYQGIAIDRAPLSYTVYSASGTSASETVAPKNDSFGAWYLQGSWVLTGESKAYNPKTAAFSTPKPAQPFSLENGTWGAWEIAARYSDTNLNDNLRDSSNAITAWSGSARTYTFFNTVRGGEQQVYTFGLNWYPNSSVRFLLDYMLIDVGKMGTTASSTALPTKDIGQSMQVVSLRSQLAF